MEGDHRRDIASPEEHDDQSEREFFDSWIRRYRRDPGYENKVPPMRIFRYTGIFEEAWGWDRLLPHYNVSDPTYLEYLKEYHKRNRMDYVAAAAGNSNPEEWPLESRAANDGTKFDPNGSLVGAAQYCLDMEQRFMAAWKSQKRRLTNVEHLSRMIQERARSMIDKSQEFSETAVASLVCIANEAVLASELLDRGAIATDEEIKLCNLIRHCALNFMDMTDPESAAPIAAMVGVAKEARIMCNWMREVEELYVFRTYHQPSHKMHLCDMIRVPGFKVMKHILTNSTRDSNTYVVMDFEKKKKKNKRPKTNMETSNEKLSEGQLAEREKYIAELERKLSDRDRELDALKSDHKKDLLREQTKELAKARSVCDNSEAERAQHQQIHYIQECLQEKENKLLALEEQHKVAQEKLRRAHSLIARVGEIYMLHSMSQGAELCECTEQFDPYHTTLQQQSVEQAYRELNSGYAESRTENKLYNMAAQFKSNIVNQADTLRSTTGPCIPKEPALLDEGALLACIVRAVSACPNSRISISSALQLLGIILGPLDWDFYENRYGKLHDFVASHPEFFVIDGDFIHLRDSEGAQQFVSDPTAAASSSAPCSSLLPSVAVAPVVQITPHKIAPALGSRPSNSMPSDDIQPGQSSRGKLLANGGRHERSSIHPAYSGGKQQQRSVDASR